MRGFGVRGCLLITESLSRAEITGLSVWNHSCPTSMNGASSGHSQAGLGICQGGGMTQGTHLNVRLEKNAAVRLGALWWDPGQTSLRKGSKDIRVMGFFVFVLFFNCD